MKKIEATSQSVNKNEKIVHRKTKLSKSSGFDFRLQFLLKKPAKKLLLLKILAELPTKLQK